MALLDNDEDVPQNAHCLPNHFPKYGMTMMEMTTSICLNDSSHSSWTMASSSASVSPLSLPESISESAVPKDEGYEGGVGGCVVCFRQGTDIVAGCRRGCGWAQDMCGYVWICVDMGCLTKVRDTRCQNMNEMCVLGCSPTEASRSGERHLYHSYSLSPPPPHRTMPPTQRHPAGINPYAAPHPAKQQPRNQPTKPPHRPHPPRPSAPCAKVENFGPPAWRTVLHNRVDFGKYSQLYMGPSLPRGRIPRLLSVQTRLPPARGCAHRGKRQERLRRQAVRLRGRAYAVPAAYAERLYVRRPRRSRCMDLYTSICRADVSICSCSSARTLSRSKRNLCRSSSMCACSCAAWWLTCAGRERSFRIPGRVIYTDNKRLGFLADLGNPDIPLHWLMRNQIPHGFKGVELLDVMFSPLTTVRQPPPNLAPMDPIPIDRAIWLIRVIGSNDIAAHRARQHQTATSVPAPSPAAATPSSTTTVTATPALPVSSNDWYSQEFTNTVISWLRIQLGQLALPNTVKVAGKLPVTKAASGILQDEKARAKWLAKWDYR